jgi:hypothetical protein
MSYSGDQWGRPQPPPPLDQQPRERRARGPLGCYLAVVGLLAVCTVISFAVSRQGGDTLMAWAFLILTVGAVVVPILLRNIAHAAKRWRE